MFMVVEDPLQSEGSSSFIVRQIGFGVVITIVVITLRVMVFSSRGA
jgi:hypothetical protein